MSRAQERSEDLSHVIAIVSEEVWHSILYAVGFPKSKHLHLKIYYIAAVQLKGDKCTNNWDQAIAHHDRKDSSW